MFCDIKEQLDNPDVLQIMAYSEYESAKQKASEFRRYESWQLYGWVENGEIIGVCRFEVHKGFVEILNIAVAENVRHHGIGGKMVTTLWEKYEMAIEAETDDDRLSFIVNMALKHLPFKNIMCGVGLVYYPRLNPSTVKPTRNGKPEYTPSY